MESRKRKYASRKCCVDGCRNNDLEHHMHTFPVLKPDGSNVESHLSWVQKTGNRSLLHIEPVALNRRYHICAVHFDDAQHVSPTKRQKLKKNAVPSLLCPNTITEDEIKLYKSEHFPELNIVNDNNAVSNTNYDLNSATLCRENSGNGNVSYGTCLGTNYEVVDSEAPVEIHGEYTMESDDNILVGSEVGMSSRQCVEGTELNESCFKSIFTVGHDHNYAAVCCVTNDEVVGSEVPVEIHGEYTMESDDNILVESEAGTSSKQCVEGTELNESCFKSIFTVGHDHNYASVCRVTNDEVVGSEAAVEIHGEYTMESDDNILVESEAGTSSKQCVEGTELNEGCFKSIFTVGHDHNYASVCRVTNDEVVGFEAPVEIHTECTMESQDCILVESVVGTSSNQYEEATEIDGGCVESIVIENNESIPRNVLHGRISRKCCVVGCCNNNLTHTMFSFPRVVRINCGINTVDDVWMQRCQQYMKFCGNDNIFSKDVSSLHKHFYICDSHFKNSDYHVMNGRKYLSKIAVPCLLPPPEPLPEHRVFAFCQSSRVVSEGDSCDVLGASQTIPQLELRQGESEKYADVKSARSRNLARRFENMMKSFKVKFCSICKEKYVHYPGLKRAHRTPQHCKKFSSVNNMDPLEVPIELKDLTYVEEMLIARIHPVLSVFKLKGLQYGYRGNVISFSQDVNEFAKLLPHRIDELRSVITVKFANRKCDKTTDFRVRVHKVRAALLWLKENNPYYANIEISDENLELLPEDDNVYDRLLSITISEVSEASESEEDEAERADFDEESSESDSECELSQVNSSGVPFSCVQNQNDQITSALKWPDMGKDPVSEYLPGLFACSFPTLFPYGNCDFRDPREKNIHLHEYIKHLLCYGDDRFANHKTFRFFAFNLWMRHTALTQGNLFVNKDAEVSKLNVEQLKERIESCPSMMKKVMFMGSNIRGSKSYWKSRCGELRDMVEQLGLPTIFLTMSAADLYWPDLFRLLTGKDIADIRMQERRRLLQENPSLVDMFFQFRVESYIENVLEPKFGVVDYWYRIEYQHRGSPHLHGLFWLKNAPDVTKYKDGNEDEKKRITKFFDDLVTAVDPEPNCPLPEKHPCEVLFEDVENIETDLAQLLKKVQRHSCSRAYCKRFDKKSKKTVCRFHFPVDLKPCSELKVNEDTSEIEFFPERNDTQLNKFNPFIISTWRANIDVAPVLSKKAVINYLTKYVSKSEVRSTTLKEICSSVCADLNGNDKAKRAIQSILIKNCVERDVSAQEVCHILNGCKLFSAGGRKFVVVYTNESKWIPVGGNESESNCDNVENDADDSGDNVVTNTSGSSKGKSFMEKYACRPKHMELLSMWNVAKHYNVNTWAKCRKYNIVRIFPRLKLSSDESKNEEYYRQQLLLHVKWNKMEDLREDGESWKDAYVRHGLVQDQETDLSLDFEANSGAIDDHADEEESPALLNSNQEDWMIACRLRPNAGGSETVELGRREVDIAHDWSLNSSKYECYGDFMYLTNFIENQKKNCTEQEIAPDVPNVTFTVEQNAVKQCMESQIEAFRNGNEPVVKRVLVQGKAGTGKSLLIKFLTDKLSKEFDVGSYLLMGPTGVSAVNIGGSTIHSALNINPKLSFYKELQGETAKEFCDKLSNVKFIVIDEYSMISCSLFALIDKRLREATGINEPFGNLCIYCFGDYKQLPPVFGPALFGGVCKNELEIHGRNMFNSFQSYFVLEKVHRQKDGEFLNILDRLSNGDTTLADYEVLKKRFITNVTRGTEKSFENAIRLFSTKKAVKAFNLSKLNNICDDNGNLVPIARVPAQHHGEGAHLGSEDDFSGLLPELYVGVGTRVMLRNNLWVTKSLVNGSMGTVCDLLYEEGKSSPDDSPTIIMVKFDNYNGPGIGPDNLVPIGRVTRYWTKKGSGENCSRNQFPLMVCYACTIHKSQGLTLDQAVIDIGPAEFHLGVSYVGLSRVKSLDGLLLQPFCLKRITNIKNRMEMNWRRSFEMILAMHKCTS